MSFPAGSDGPRPADGRAPNAARRRGCVLIMEPDPLMRWSMSTYLRRWFDVTAVESAEQASGFLGSQRLAAMVFSDAVPLEQARQMERRARAANPAIVIVCTVTGAATSVGAGCARIEKPFELASLARLLGAPTGRQP